MSFPAGRPMRAPFVFAESAGIISPLLLVSPKPVLLFRCEDVENSGSVTGSVFGDFFSNFTGIPVHGFDLFPVR